MVMSFFKFDTELSIINLGIISLLIGLSSGAFAYLTGLQFIYYFSFVIILVSLLFMLYAMSMDLDKLTKTPIISVAFIILLVILYFSQRMIPIESSFMAGDASNYFWSGVSSSIHGNDIGFFPPLTSSVSAIGYQLFGLKYTALMTVIIYFFSIPLIYFLFRKSGVSTILSYLLVLLLSFVPLSIWLSKATFSEPIWQIMILVFISYTYILSNKKTLSLHDLSPFFILILLFPLSRGSAVILYGGIAFLSFYHYWKYKNFRIALTILFAMVLLAISIHYSLNIRTRYLIEWQYRRILPGITVNSLLVILYTIPLLSVGVLSIFRWHKAKFQQINLPLILVIFSIVFKVAVALYFSIKKQLDFPHLFYLNEFGLAEGNFGFILAVLIMIGLIYIHYKAASGDGLFLTLIIVYALFSIPFTMQGIAFEKPHELLLYWNRYYFSEFFVIHFFALGIFFKLLFDLLHTFIAKERNKLLLMIPIIMGLFFYSINIKLHQIVSSEGNLTNSSKIFTWLTERVKGEKLSIVYSSKIHYDDFDAKRLLFKGFHVMGNSIKSYQKVPESTLDANLRFRPDVSKSELLLCLSTSSCNLDPEKFTMIDTLSSPIWWRVHKDDIADGIGENMVIRAYLYKIKQLFKINEKIIISNESDIAPTLLGKGWYPIDENGVWSRRKAEIKIPNVWKGKRKKYSLKLKFSVFDASIKKPKKVFFTINNTTILKEIVTNPETMEYHIKLPQELLKMSEKILTIIVKVPNAAFSYERGDRFRYQTKKGISLLSVSLAEKI